MTQVKPIPAGFGTVTPNLVVADGAAAIALSERAFGDHVRSDRAGSVRDPFGHRWATATHVRDVPEAEIAQQLGATS
jgi:PhnB protein